MSTIVAIIDVFVSYCVSKLAYNCPLYNSVVITSVLSNIVLSNSWFSIPFVYFAVYVFPELCNFISEFAVISTLFASAVSGYIYVIIKPPTVKGGDS